MKMRDYDFNGSGVRRVCHAVKVCACGIVTYRQFLLLFLGMLTAFGPLVTDMYLPVFPAMTGWFGASQSMVQLSLTSCMVGLAAGQLVFGPVSDRYGRRPVLRLSLLMFVVSTLLCIFAEDVRMFVTMRLFQGVAAAGSIVIARSVAADIYTGRELGRVLAAVGAVNGVAPVMAPVIGGLMAGGIGWRGIFFVLLLSGVFLLAAAGLFRESLPPARRSSGSVPAVLSSFVPLLRNRTYMCFMLQMGFAQAVLFANIASAPFIMQGHYGFSALRFSVFFGLNAFVIVVSAALAVKFRSMRSAALYGSSGVLLFAVCECAALFAGCGFWIYEAFMAGLMFSLGLCFTASTAVAMDSGRKSSGCASALLGASGFAFGGLVSPLVGIGNPLHSAGVAFVVCALCSSLCVFVGRKTACRHGDKSQ